MSSMECNGELRYKFRIFHETKENHRKLDGVSRSQDILEAGWLLTNSLASNKLCK
jgi:hypothetical protein